MTKPLFAFVLIIAALLAATDARAQLKDENLLTVLPKGYKVDFQERKNNVLITEMVPAAESVKNWTEMVTVQIFFGMKNVTPEQFKQRMEQLWVGSCKGSEVHQIAQGPERGYPALIWMQSCPLNNATSKPEITWLKAIRGNDSFYLVQKAFEFMPSKEQVVEWTQYLRGVYVCDTRVPDRPCPTVNR